MNQLKQIILVVAILFLSLLTSVGLSYVITPGAQATTVTKKAEPKPTETAAFDMNVSLKILIPKVTE